MATSKQPDPSFMPQRERDPAQQAFESMTASQALLVADERDRLAILICVGYDWDELIGLAQSRGADDAWAGKAMREVALQAAEAALEVLHGAFRVGVQGPTI